MDISLSVDDCQCYALLLRRVSLLLHIFPRCCRQIPEVIFNGDEATNYPGCVNLSFAYIEGESLLMALKEIALSSGRCVRRNREREREGGGGNREKEITGREERHVERSMDVEKERGVVSDRLGERQSALQRALAEAKWNDNVNTERRLSRSHLQQLMRCSASLSASLRLSLPRYASLGLQTLISARFVSLLPVSFWPLHAHNAHTFFVVPARQHPWSRRMFSVPLVRLRTWPTRPSALALAALAPRLRSTLSLTGYVGRGVTGVRILTQGERHATFRTTCNH